MAEQVAVELDWPLGRLPAYLIVDDGAPVYNLDRWEFPDESHHERIPNAMVTRFADAMVPRGVRGKFTVIPYPMGLGRIDQGLPDVDPGELLEFTTLVSRDVAPYFNITPEILTHLNAVDLDHGWAPLPYSERRMISHHSEQSLTAYLRTALDILANVGLEPTGITSPGDFGIEAEEMYAHAVARALWSRRGVTVPFFFLHVDRVSPVLSVRVWPLGEGSLGGPECVSVQVPSGAGDAFWPTKYARPATTDRLIDAAGEHGRLVSLVQNRSPVGLHTHWQSLFSNGSLQGLGQLEVLVDRLNSAFGDRIHWMRCSDLAVSAAVRASVELSTRSADGGAVVDVDTRYPAGEFTLRVRGKSRAGAVRVNGRPLREAAAPSKDAYWSEGATVVLAWDLSPGHSRVEVQWDR